MVNKKKEKEKVRMREQQNRKEIMLGEFEEKKQFCNGDLPVTIIWRNRANRQEMLSTGGNPDWRTERDA